jgi:ribosomal protein L40E
VNMRVCESCGSNTSVHADACRWCGKGETFRAPTKREKMASRTEAHHYKNGERADY